MPRIGDTYKSNSPLLKVEDLQGRKVNVTITAAPVETVGEDQKIVLYFEGKDKKLGLNVTNARMLEMLTGSDNSDDWVGYTITLKPDVTSFQGKPTKCIRIDSELPQQVQGHPQERVTAQQSGAFGGQPQGGGFGFRDTTQQAKDSDVPF